MSEITARHTRPPAPPRPPGVVKVEIPADVAERIAYGSTLSAGMLSDEIVALRKAIGQALEPGVESVIVPVETRRQELAESLGVLTYGKPGVGKTFVSTHDPWLTLLSMQPPRVGQTYRIGGATYEVVALGASGEGDTTRRDIALLEVL